MGAEALCNAAIKGRTVEGTARLETDVLQFRGGSVRLSIPFVSSSKNGAVGESPKRKPLFTKAGPHGLRIKFRANSGGFESTSAADESFAQRAASKRASQ